MALSVTAIGAGGTIKSTFFPTIDQDVITANLELPLGTDELVVNRHLQRMEEAVWEVNESYTQSREDSNQVVKYVERIVGPNSNEGRLNVYMLEGDKRGILSFEIADAIRQKGGAYSLKHVICRTAASRCLVNRFQSH